MGKQKIMKTIKNQIQCLPPNCYKKNEKKRNNLKQNLKKNRKR